jgi:hypothetical protein
MTENDKMAEKKQAEQDTQKAPGEPEQDRRHSAEEQKDPKHTDDSAAAHKEPQLLDEPIKVKDYIYLNILTLEGKAWAYMDKIAHPETQKHQKDMEQAKLAIDTIDLLYKQLETHLTSDQKKDLQTRLANLRLNYVK